MLWLNLIKTYFEVVSAIHKGICVPFNFIWTKMNRPFRERKGSSFGDLSKVGVKRGLFRLVIMESPKSAI